MCIILSLDEKLKAEIYYNQLPDKVCSFQFYISPVYKKYQSKLRHKHLSLSLKITVSIPIIDERNFDYIWVSTLRKIYTYDPTENTKLTFHRISNQC
jgi:hypothetical protein